MRYTSLLIASLFALPAQSVELTRSCHVVNSLAGSVDKFCIERGKGMAESSLRSLCDSNKAFAAQTSGSSAVSYSAIGCKSQYLAYCETSMFGAETYRTYAYNIEFARNLKVSCNTAIPGIPPGVWNETRSIDPK